MEVVVPEGRNTWRLCQQLLFEKTIYVYTFSYCIALLTLFGIYLLNSPPDAGMLWMYFSIAAIAATGLLSFKHVMDRMRSESDELRQSVKELTSRAELAEGELDSAKESFKEATQNLIIANNVALENLIRSNKELDDFAYIASHDLKEPLRGIHTYSDILLEDYGDKLDEEGIARLDRLAVLTQRLDSLIDSLLHYSRLGRTDLAIADTCLDDVVHDVMDTLQAVLEDKSIDVRIPGRLPTVRCDRVRIGEVFRNLITNSIKYNDKAEKWIELGHLTMDQIAESVPSDRMHQNEFNSCDSLVFYVRDNGIGIKKKHLDTIFRIFKRLHGRDKFDGGSGAGLTIAKKIVERHGGRIWVDSEHGTGSTFYFTLMEDSINAYCN